MKNIENIANFIFELGMLKRESHSGLNLAGIKHPPSVAEHVFRASQIGYLLAMTTTIQTLFVLTNLV